ncbi:hypothetical protein D3C75_647640 [compost metagenome]
MLTAHFHTYQRSGQLFWLQLAAHNRSEQLVALFPAQGLRFIQFVENRLQRVGLF